MRKLTIIGILIVAAALLAAIARHRRVTGLEINYTNALASCGVPISFTASNASVFQRRSLQLRGGPKLEEYWARHVISQRDLEALELAVNGDPLIDLQDQPIAKWPASEDRPSWWNLQQRDVVFAFGDSASTSRRTGTLLRSYVTTNSGVNYLYVVLYDSKRTE